MTAARVSFARVFGAELPGLYAAARSYAASQEDAEDLVQEAMLNAYRAYTPEKPLEYPKAWLHTVLRNVAIDRARKRSRGPEQLSVDDPGAGLMDRLQAGVETGQFSDPVRLVARWSDQESVRAAFEELPEQAREVLVLSHVAGLRYREITEVLDVPMGTVMSRLNRARASFEHLFAEQLNLPEPLAQPVPANVAESSVAALPARLAEVAKDPSLGQSARPALEALGSDSALSAATKCGIAAALVGEPVGDPPPQALVEVARAALIDPGGLASSEIETASEEGWGRAEVADAMQVGTWTLHLIGLGRLASRAGLSG